MTPRSRLLFHVPTLRSGGAERVIVLLANEMAQRGHEVILLVWSKEGPNDELVDKGVRLVSFDLPSRDGGFGKMGTLRGIVRTAAFLSKGAPDAVFSALDLANALMGVSLALSRSKSRFFPTYHAASVLKTGGFIYSLVPLLDRLTIRRATRAIGVSVGVGRDLVARGFSADRVVSIPNPVQLPKPNAKQAASWIRDLAALGEGPVIATLGRLVEVKDHRTLLKAFQKLQPSLKARLAIFGEGPLEEALKSYAKELKIEDRVLFAGYTNDPAACYEAADLFVLSSTSEGFGNVIVEALAVGLPVVCTDAPHGPREILADGEYGKLVPVGDPDALADAMERGLSDPHDRQVSIARAQVYDLRTIGDAYEALLNIRG